MDFAALPPVEQMLRIGLPMLLAAAAALGIDLWSARRDRLPPGFAVAWRRALAAGALAAVLYLGVFASLATLGRGAELAPTPDPASFRPWQLFLLHGLLAAVLVTWGLLAYAGRVAPRHLPRRLARAFRLRVRPVRLAREVGIGLLAGAAIWGAVLVAVVVLATVLSLAGLEDWLPAGPPGLVAVLAAQPFWLRLAGSLSAGLCEETFFRGFLQPRVGITASTALFVLAHWNYGEPFMLVGVTLLSLAYAGLARWRRNVWAAVAAHALFDAVQLLVLLPLALKAAETLDGVQALCLW